MLQMAGHKHARTKCHNGYPLAFLGMRHCKAKRQVFSLTNIQCAYALPRPHRWAVFYLVWKRDCQFLQSCYNVYNGKCLFFFFSDFVVCDYYCDMWKSKCDFVKYHFISRDFQTNWFLTRLNWRFFPFILIFLICCSANDVMAGFVMWWQPTAPFLIHFCVIRCKYWKMEYIRGVYTFIKQHIL